MFNGCSSLISLPDISKWNTKNISGNHKMLYGNSSTNSIISDNYKEYPLENDTGGMNGIFGGCSSLKSLPDISKWDTKNVTNMDSMFNGCSSLI